MRKFVFIMIMLFFVQSLALGEEINFAHSSVGLSKLNTLRSAPKLYRPNRLYAGQQAVFKVTAIPNSFVLLAIDYDFEPQAHTYQSKTNEMGLCTFKVTVPAVKDIIGKTARAEAMVWQKEDKTDITKAQTVNSIGNPGVSSRMVIVESNTAKGFVISPSSDLNEYMINNDYSEDSNFDLYNDQMYNNSTPAYIRNMRDAKDNVNQKPPQNTNNSNR